MVFFLIFRNLKCHVISTNRYRILYTFINFCDSVERIKIGQPGNNPLFNLCRTILYTKLKEKNNFVISRKSFYLLTLLYILNESHTRNRGRGPFLLQSGFVMRISLVRIQCGSGFFSFSWRLCFSVFQISTIPYPTPTPKCVMSSIGRPL